MAYENKAGLNVNNQYGPRDTGGGIGLERSIGAKQTLVIDFTGDSLNSSFMPPVYLPKGAKPISYLLRVDEAFVLTGTSPVVVFGQADNIATNYVALIESELESVGFKVPASNGAGEWHKNTGTGVTATKLIGKTITGTTPVVQAGVGKGQLIIEYVHKSRV